MGGSSVGHWQPLPAESLRKPLRVFRLSKAEHHEVAIVATSDYVSCAADRAPAALNITSLFLRPRTFSAGSPTWCGQLRLRSLRLISPLRLVLRGLRRIRGVQDAGGRRLGPGHTFSSSPTKIPKKMSA
jgi:hypothetical protein